MKVVFCYRSFENVGLEYLSASLKKSGADTELIFDPALFNDPFVSIGPLAKIFDHTASLPKKIVAAKPDLVGFSVNASDYRWALTAAQGLKTLSDTPVVFGGIHVTSAPAAVMENPQVDYCVVGEGEPALVELAEAIEKGRSLSGIKNLCYRKGDKVFYNPLRPLIYDLDELPFPDKELYYDVIPGFARNYTLLTRRGCVNSCSHCHNTVWNRLYPEHSGRERMRTVDNVLSELALARFQWDFKRLRINDDLFSSDMDWLFEFCRLYKSEIARPFLCSCSPSDLTKQVVLSLKSAGCYQVRVEVSDINELGRKKIYNQHTPQDKVVRALSNLREHKLRATVDNILGYAGQTESDIEKIADFYLDNPVYGRFTVSRLIYFADTKITETALKRGAVTADEYKDLEQNPPENAGTPAGDVGRQKRLKQLHLFLVLMQIFPRRLARWVFDKKRYRRLPSVNPGFVERVRTLFAWGRLDVEQIRFFAKYFYFGRKKIIEKVTGQAQ